MLTRLESITYVPRDAISKFSKFFEVTSGFRIFGGKNRFRRILHRTVHILSREIIVPRELTDNLSGLMSRFFLRIPRNFMSGNGPKRRLLKLHSNWCRSNRQGASYSKEIQISRGKILLPPNDFLLRVSDLIS